MCLNPKYLYRQGHYKEDNYAGKKGDFYEIDTFTNCGHCAQCIALRANNWVIRNHYESLMHKEISFITLTYAKSTFFLIKKDLQDFIKRLRRQLEYHYKYKIRFFACGEYGEKTGRPHFHIIIYGWTDKNAKFTRLSKRGYPIYESELIKKCWGKGLTAYQDFKDKEIPYIALYETPQQEGRHIFKIHIDKAKELIKTLKDKKIYQEHRLIIIKTLKKELKKAEKEKEKYIQIREFNTWSQALGWQSFYNFFKTQEKYDWREYIKDTEFFTPTPWVKKLANSGNKSAVAEMLRRAELLSKEETENSLKAKNIVRENTRKNEEIYKWNEDTKKKTEL